MTPQLASALTPSLSSSWACWSRQRRNCVVSAFLKEWGVTLYASHMLASNIHPKIVQERLGHSSIAITMDISSHMMPNMQREAAAAVDGALRAAINRRTD